MNEPAQQAELATRIEHAARLARSKGYTATEFLLLATECDMIAKCLRGAVSSQQPIADQSDKS